MRNIFTITDYQKAIDYLVTMPQSNEQKVKMVVGIMRVFKADSKSFNPDHFEECVWSNNNY